MKKVRFYGGFYKQYRKLAFHKTRNNLAIFWGLWKRMHRCSPEWNEMMSTGSLRVET